MKWKRLATEFLPEKTFLIIRDDLKPIGVKKENSIGRTRKNSTLETGTWPPKLKNGNHRYRGRSVIGERPKTANLEGPSVLDPRLLNTLDMSLVRKESLGDSMTRIHHRSVRSDVGAGGGGTTRNTTSDFSKRRRSVPLGEKSGTFSRRASTKPTSTSVSEEEKRDASTVSLPIVCAIGSRKQPNSEESSRNDSGKSKREVSSDSPMTKQRENGRFYISSGESRGSPSNGRAFETKRLDDNNNKNGTGNANDKTIAKICPLTVVKKNKASKLGAPAEIEVFTGGTIRSAPEPCKTCGRPDQPERFHSHPKSSALPVKRDPSEDVPSSGKSKTAVPKTIQKPVALNFRSDKTKRNKKSEMKVESPKNGKADSPTADSKRENDRTSSLNPSRRPPRSVTCYVCAREFGSAGFPIHEPKCIQKWERENNLLPVTHRRSTPQRPNSSLDDVNWNAAAWERSQALLVPCWKCGRTFFPDKLEIHEKNCKCTRKIESAEKLTSPEKPKNNIEAVSRAVPPTVLRQICGRNFGTRSIKMHEPRCIKKSQNNNESLPSNDPPKEPRRVERSADYSSREYASSVPSSVKFSGVEKSTTTCYICGRDFGSASIEIHEPQCLRKWRNENSKLPTHQRRNEPQRPNIIYTSESSSTDPIVDWAATNEALWNSHLGQLVPCKHCKRTFNPDRVTVHERSCKGIR